MKRRLETSSPPSRKRGLTLLEVLAAVAILAGMLTALLIARGNAQRQWAAADLRLEAIDAADEQLQQWWAEELVPLDKEGDWAQHPNLRWRTFVTQRPEFDAFDSAVVCLEVQNAADKTVLSRVELWVPDVEKDPAAAATRPTKKSRKNNASAKGSS